MELNDKVVKILEEVRIVDDKPVFTDENRLLIHEVSEECKKLDIYQKNRFRQPGYKRGLTAEDVYIDMLYKISAAPTRLHSVMTARLLIPVIDDMLREEIS